MSKPSEDLAAATPDLQTLTFDVIRAAADLLAHVEEMPVRAQARSGLTARAFATTMCRSIAHLVEVEQATLALADTHLATLPGATSKVLTQRRTAWTAAATALEHATTLGDQLRSRVGTAHRSDKVAPVLMRLLGLCEQISVALTLLQPPTPAVDLDAGLNKLRGRPAAAEPAVTALTISPPPAVEESTAGQRRRPWWEGAQL